MNAHNVRRIRYYNLDHVYAQKDSDYRMMSVLVVIKVAKIVIQIIVLNVMIRNFYWIKIVSMIVPVDFIKLVKFVEVVVSCVKLVSIRVIFVFLVN
jgi:hypothetical protein